MPYISVPEAQAWLETTKLTLPVTLDAELESHVSSLVLGSLSRAYDTTEWVSDVTTPKLVRSAIAMMYAGYLYNRQYSEDYDGSSYGDKLIGMATVAVSGIVDGSIDLPEVDVPASSAGAPSFYPDDAAGALDPNEGVKFTMNRVW